MQTASSEPSKSITIDMEPNQETRALVATIRESVATAKGVTVITTDDEYRWAADEAIRSNTAVKRLTEQRLAITRPMDEAKRQVMELFDKPIKAAEAIVGHCKKLMLAFDQEKERRRQEEQARLRREAEEQAARERAEAERLRREAEEQERQARERAEAERRAAEQAAQEARAAGDAAAEAKAQAEAEAAVQRDLEAAQAAEDAKAHADAMDATADMIQATPAQALVEAPPTVDGVQKRSNWKAEVTDVQALILAAADGLRAGNPMIAGLLEPNTKAIGALAKGLKSSASVPGIRFYDEPIIATSRG